MNNQFKIFYSKIKANEDVFNYLSVLEREEINRINHEKVKLEKAYSYALLRYVLKNYFSISEYVLEKNKNGKPFLSSHKSIYFNISHSNDIIVLIVGEENCAIDIEYTKKEIKEAIINKCFSSKEKQMLEENEEQMFFEIWTAKEAFSKLDGRGISIIPKIDVDIENEIVTFENMEYKFSRINSILGYTMCYFPSEPTNIEEIII